MKAKDLRLFKCIIKENVVILENKISLKLNFLDNLIADVKPVLVCSSYLKANDSEIFKQAYFAHFQFKFDNNVTP